MDIFIRSAYIMRTIREMLKNEEKVWLYLDSNASWEKFVETAVKEGFCFGSLPADKWVSGHVIAIHSNGDMGHIPLFLWCISFSDDAETQPRKIDFDLYMEGKENYLCTTPHFKMRTYVPKSR
jgi:hypothetical protein